MYVYLIALFATIALAAEDLYKILDVSSEASEAEISKAFRKLSVQYHPDKNPNNRERYLSINRAHDVLTDPEKRQLYDLYGEEGLSNPQYRNRPKGPNASADIPVTLEDLYNGGEREFTMQKKVICKKCKGSGSKDGLLKVCKHCNGRGVRMQNAACDRCGGRGKITSGNCPDCRGNMVLPVSKTLKIEIERGMMDQQNIVFRGESEQHPDYLAGDVVFTLRQAKHAVFTRQGQDLHMNLNISLKEAILGFKKRVRHLDNHYVEVESSAIIQPFEVKVIKEEGMPIHQLPSVRGDLYIKFIVDLPNKLSSKDKELLLKIF